MALVYPNQPPFSIDSFSQSSIPSQDLSRGTPYGSYSTRRSSIASTPLETSPPLHRNMSFTMSQGQQNAGMMMQPGSFRQYVDAAGPANDAAPQIYSAIYSGVDVYEMEVNGIAAMRRRNDSWLNATQILKIAGIDKGKRTKVLEKEILIGEHEKVQGGYGKYQGTWIKFDRGLEFCRQYGVEEVLRPLLTYDMGQDGGVAGQGGIDTPTKEQAMAAQRKRLYNSGNDGRTNGNSGTFFKNISSTASHAVAAISKARFDSPAPRIKNGNSRPASFSRQSSQQYVDSQDSAFPGGSQQSMQSFVSDNSFNMNGNDAPYMTQSGPHFSHQMSNGDFQEPPRKRIRPSPNVSMSQPTNEQFYDPMLRDATPTATEPNESFVYRQHEAGPIEDEVPMALAALPMVQTKIAETKRALLMSLFMDPERSDFSSHEAFLTMSGEDIDMPIDNTAHTALHWAATLARLPLLKALIAAGASICRVNGGGETALMRACAVRNNLDMSSFPELLELLGPTIEIRDNRGRTVLHHIAVTSAVKGRSSVSKYYLESLLEFVVRSGSAPNSQHAFFGAPTYKSMGIGRFMSEIVNAQDKSGDTALNIAARIGNRGIISQLLEVGSDAGIPNRAGLKPVDFGIGDPAEVHGRQVTDSEKTLQKSTRESSGDIISSITSLLSETEKEFATEMESKQAIIDSIHAQLRESSAQLGEQRRHLEEMQARAKEKLERKQKIANLRRAEEEERAKLVLMSQHSGSHSPTAGDMALGEADQAMSVLAPNIPPSAILHDPRLAASLPSTAILRARVNAYRANNEVLESAVKSLKSQSRDLESRYRRVITLCAGVPDAKIDGMLESLCKAVESEEGDVELARVRDFLHKVEGVE